MSRKYDWEDDWLSITASAIRTNLPNEARRDSNLLQSLDGARHARL